MPVKNIYCLSGLGADERIFKNLSVPGFNLVHLPWVKHDREDTLVTYAAKMSRLIKEDNPIVLGLSFGGMLAIEIAKTRNVQKAILISSAKTKSGLTPPGVVFIALVNSRIVPSFVYSIPNFYICKLFGAKTSEEKTLLNSIIRDSDGVFVKWALHAVTNWQNEVVPPGVLHIHGTNDKVLQSAVSKPDYWIEGGTHMMVYNRAGEISALISKNLL